MWVGGWVGSVSRRVGGEYGLGEWVRTKEYR